MLKNPRDGIIPDKPGYIGPIIQIELLKQKRFPLAYIGDIVGTRSSRKSAANSLLWYIGHNIPYVPNKKIGGILIAKKIAPIFFETLIDSGALPIEADTSNIKNGDIVNIYPFRGKIWNYNNTQLLSKFILKNSLLNEIRVGGRITFIIGRDLTRRSRKFINLEKDDICKLQKAIFKNKTPQYFTLVQKIIGKACGVPGISP